MTEMTMTVEQMLAEVREQVERALTEIGAAAHVREGVEAYATRRTERDPRPEGHLDAEMPGATLAEAVEGLLAGWLDDLAEALEYGATEWPEAPLAAEVAAYTLHPLEGIAGADGLGVEVYAQRGGQVERWELTLQRGEF